MRVATCLPSATEIVCAVGGRVALIVVSRACDWPAGPGGITELPRFGDVPADAADPTAHPDLVITDDPAALGHLGDTRVLVLAPRSLADVFADIVRVGEALDLGLTARAVVTGLRARLQAVSERAQALPVPPNRPRVRLRTSTDAPPIIGGPAGPYPWLDELLAHAGGAPASPADPADLELTLDAQATAYVTRPGPRLIDAIELLAAALHPAAFPELVRRHAGRDVTVRRADPPALPR